MERNRKIAVLPEAVASKIAAGEVIERPSSIVKELLENAVDAGATDIAIDLRGGGKESIRIADNGSGISPGDVPVAFERHATSKILSVEDLYAVRSFGFRGEALPSIAAVSRVEMATRRRGDVEGTRIVVENGRILEQEAVGCPEGTTITVSRIFDPLPVRRKFLRQDATEQGHCLDTIVRVLLPHRHVRATVTAGDRAVLEVPRTESLRDRIVLLLGSDLRNHLVAVEAEASGMRVAGFASRPDFTRSSTRSMFFYVNGRYVRDVLLSQAVMNAYRNLLEARKYPACALFVELPPDAIDVNVHPAKLEVRFRRPQDVRDLIHRGLAGALAGVRPTAGPDAAPGVFRPAAPGRTGVAEALRRYSLSAGMAAARPSPPSRIREDVPDFGPGPGDLFAQGSAPQQPLRFSSLDYLGQVDGTYLVFAAPGAMILLDQHAAHERILYEQFLAEAVAGETVSQHTLESVVVELSLRDFALIEENLQALARLGFLLEPFGATALRVRAIPAMLARTDPAEAVRLILADLEVGAAPGQRKLEEIIALRVCKAAAVKAGQILSIAEMQAIIRQLERSQSPHTCPHGRPTLIHISAEQLARQFGRT